MQSSGINKSEYLFVIVKNMFKPSLRKSVLNDNLCLTSQTKNDCFGIPTPQKPQPVVRFIDKMDTSPTLSLPSMMIPEQILQNHQFSNNNHYTHVFTPLSYDFKPYPQAVRQIIAPNPKAAQAGRIKQISYLLYEKCMFMWKSNGNDHGQQMLKVHKFQENINIANFSVVKNQKMFKKSQVIILAVSFGNKIRIFKVDQNELKIEDLLIKYQLKSCRFIQKIRFTEKNEIIFAGDSGQFSMISLNNSKELIVKIKSSVIKTYLSKSAFDYFTRHLIIQVEVSDTFLYCLHDRISKSNYFMYLLKKAVNKVVSLSQEPKYIHEQTFIDIYKFTSAQRKEVSFVGQLKQKQIEKKIKEGYVNFWGEGLKDAFRIVSINAKGQQNPESSKKTQPQSSQKPILGQLNIKPIDLSDLVIPVIQLTTKCGYLFSVIHESSPRDGGSSSQKQSFSFVAQPTKLPQKIGDASLFEPKVFLSAPQQREYRKNFVICSVPLSKEQSLILMNDSLILNQKKNLSVVKFSDLKLGLFESTTQEEFYLSEEDFNNAYQVTNGRKSQNSNQQSLFGLGNITYDRAAALSGRKYYRLFSNQKRWTVFDNQGQFDIYHLQLKHLILAYLYYQCEFNAQFIRPSSQYDSNTNFLVESDLRLHSILEKMIKVYGYITFMKSLVQILINNSNEQREYFYLQRDLFLQVVKKQFEFQLSNNFEEWSYGLGQHNQAQRIVPTDKMLQFVWITLFEHQNKPVLTSQNVFSKVPVSDYSQKAKEYSEARSKLEYTAYSYGLKSIFYQIIQVLIDFRAKEFKLKEKQLRRCQQMMIHLFNFLQSKKQKSQTHQYKNYLQMKLTNLSKRREQQPHYYGTKNLNTTFSTTYSNSLNNTEQSFVGIDEQTQPISFTRGVSYQSNETLEKSIHKSIQKIISLIDVMNILIEKDERQGLPSFIEIITNFKNQIRVGEEFFKEELFISQDKVEFVHPQLVRQVENALPEFQLQNKIDFLKFKIARNIALGNSLNEVDLKSLNFDKLSSLVTSSEIPQIRKMFVGQKTQIDFQKAYFYEEFLSICLAKLIQKVRGLSAIKEQKFQSFSDVIRPDTKKKTSTLATHLTVERIILSQQQLEYYQDEMIRVFEEIKTVFKKSVDSLKSINGPQYYQTEKYLERMIELLTKNFGTQEILVQTLQIILKDANLLEKIHFMRKIKDKLMYTKDSQVQILRISKDKQSKLQERSTFQYLIERNQKKMLSQERTFDTLGANSLG